jgi:hypothetical protein
MNKTINELQSNLTKLYFDQKGDFGAFQNRKEPKARDFTVLLRTKKPVFAKSIKKRE